MPDHQAENVTALLKAWGRGEQTALEELLPLVYDELRRQAARWMRAQPGGHTLQTTDLVHDAYLRLIDHDRTGANWASRSHFFAVASKAMRGVLVDHARARQAAKRGGGPQRVSLGAVGEAPAAEADVDILGLDEALQRLAAFDQRQAQVVELRYFGGLSIEEAADALGVSHATVERDWRTARLWLKRELSAR